MALRPRGILLGVALVTLVSCIGSAGPLQDYVGTDDGTYRWSLMGESMVEGCRVSNLALVSQKWNDSLWLHQMLLVDPPERLVPDVAVLFITGSGDSQEELEAALAIAKISGFPVAVLRDVPNQPLFGGLYEDALISHTFAKFLQTGNPEDLALFPMVKSAVKAMDAVEEVLDVDRLRFVVSGASKRGWTTWLTAACDQRVIAIAPIVYDNLNLPAQMRHQLEVWPEYSPQISDYTEKGLPDLIDSPEGQELTRFVDPFFYRELIGIPKLIIQGTNDPYWPLDAA